MRDPRTKQVSNQRIELVERMKKAGDEMLLMTVNEY